MHWRKYEKESDRLASMGITACWIPRTYLRFSIILHLTMSSADKRVEHVRSDPSSSSIAEDGRSDGTGYDMYARLRLGVAFQEY